jgi:hypothetical protein
VGHPANSSYRSACLKDASPADGFFARFAIIWKARGRTRAKNCSIPMASPAFTAATDNAGRLYGVIKSIREFDKLELAGILSSVAALSPTPRESCFLATYYRTGGIVDLLLRFDNATHFQAAAMLARTLFELAVDLKLVDKIPSGWMKMVFFAEVEKLRSARQMIAFAKANPDRASDVLLQTELVRKNEMRIEQNRRTLWPPKNPNSKSLPHLKHWSELTLAERAEILGEPFDAAEARTKESACHVLCGERGRSRDFWHGPNHYRPQRTGAGLSQLLEVPPVAHGHSDRTSALDRNAVE